MKMCYWLHQDTIKSKKLASIFYQSSLVVKTQSSRKMVNFRMIIVMQPKYQHIRTAWYTHSTQSFGVALVMHLPDVTALWAVIQTACLWHITHHCRIEAYKFILRSNSMCSHYYWLFLRDEWMSYLNMPRRLHILWLLFFFFFHYIVYIISDHIPSMVRL